MRQSRQPARTRASASASRDAGEIVIAGTAIAAARLAAQAVTRLPNVTDMSTAGATRIRGVTLALEYRMPLFEYECRGCGSRFEYLTRGDQSPACPSCQGVELQKLLSVFAAQSSTPAKSFSHAPPAPCGSCGDPRGPGSC